MMASRFPASPIQLLPPSVIAQIKSSAIITSLNGVVVELVKNSLDASATKIDVRVDHSRGSCVVEDDGDGIAPLEFSVKGGLAKLYYSSKLESKNHMFGGSGTFLYSVSALSLVTITSKHNQYHSTNSLSINQSRVISREIPSFPQHQLPRRIGTKVSIRDLFGNMPVRIKHRALEAAIPQKQKKNFDELRNEITALLLAWNGPVAITLNDTMSGSKFILKSIGRGMGDDDNDSNQLADHACSLLSQARLIFSPERSSWIPVHASTKKITVCGAISIDAAPTKNIQYLSLDVQPLPSQGGYNVFYTDINKCFAKSSFGIDDAPLNSRFGETLKPQRVARYGTGVTGVEMRGSGMQVDRWPMFYLRISLLPKHSNAHISTSGAGTHEHADSVNAISELLQALCTQFLREHQVCPKRVRGLQGPQPSKTVTKSRSPAPKSSKRSCHDMDTGSGTKSTKLTSKKAKLDSDFMGINIKLPSFKHDSSRRPEAPFHGWSRVKSGAVRYDTGKDKLVMTGINKRPATAPPVLTSASSSQSMVRLPDCSLGFTRSHTASASSSSSKESAVSRVQETGKILQPFVDLPQSVSTLKFLPLTESQLVLSTHFSATPVEKLITWVDPITKCRSLIEARTGFEVPSSVLPSHDFRALTFRGKPQSAQDSPKSVIRVSAFPSESKKSPWLTNILEDWVNPVFPLTEPAIPQVSLKGSENMIQNLIRRGNHLCSQLDIDRAFKSTSSTIGKISKQALKQAEIIAQVDMKFILMTVAQNNTDTLIIVDQHAADERCRIEELLGQLCSSNSDDSARLRLSTSKLAKPIHIELPYIECQLLDLYRNHFEKWGILYSTSLVTTNVAHGMERISITHLPQVIVERCKLDPKLLIDLVRTEVWARDARDCTAPFIVDDVTDVDPTTPAQDGQYSWLRKIHDCPQGLLNMLKSRACRSAIMFNDGLTIEQCQALITRLAGCAFPFQCAHGRPSMVPLVDLSSFGSVSEVARGVGKVENPFKGWKGSL